MGVETKLLLVPELTEAPEGKVAQDEVTQEVVDENQTNLDQPVVFRSSVHDATGVIPAKLVVARKTRIPENVMFRSHETEFDERENYPSQGRPPRSPGRVLHRRRFASSERTGLRMGKCYGITEQSTCLSNVPQESRCNALWRTCL